MSISWNTKFGTRRVKQALPTVEEALEAAECMSDDSEQQVEIAASLIGADIEDVRKAARKKSRQPAQRLSIPVPSEKHAFTRSVIVERRAPKRLIGLMK